MQQRKNSLHQIKGGITAIEGFQAVGLPAGIKKDGSPDLALISSQYPCTVAALFTKNRFCAAPLLLNKKHLKKGLGRAIITNSGNANACTGEKGKADARTMAIEIAHALKIPTESVYVASTGVIGEFLPIESIIKQVPNLVNSLSTTGSLSAAEAIKTTDTYAKEAAWEGKVGQSEIRVGGIAKGSGMIHPNMATMLAFLSTDIAMDQNLLQEALYEAVDASFHRITIDGDTSTNDMVLLFATGKKGRVIRKKGIPYRQFVTLLKTSCLSLAKMLVRDAEGATKFVEVCVTGAKDDRTASKIGFKVAESLLVKTAFFGEDANWGRIVAAIGNAEVTVAPEEIDLAFGTVQLIRKGVYLGKDAEFKAGSYLKGKEIQLNISLHLGKGMATIWTSDLSLNYVKINALYRS